MTHWLVEHAASPPVGPEHVSEASRGVSRANDPHADISSVNVTPNPTSESKLGDEEGYVKRSGDAKKGASGFDGTYSIPQSS